MCNGIRMNSVLLRMKHRFMILLFYFGETGTQANICVDFHCWPPERDECYY